MFRTVPLSIIRSFSLFTKQWYVSYRFADRTEPVPSWSCSQTVSKPLWHIPLLCVEWKTADDGQRNCPKHVEFFLQKWIWEISASSWSYYKNLSSTCIVQMIVQQQEVISRHWTFICSKHVRGNDSLFFYRLDAQILYFNTFIIFLYMFRALKLVEKRL